jgi:hypothetical protein
MLRACKRAQDPLESQYSSRLMVTNTTDARDEGWRAFRRTHGVRLHERDHGLLLLMNGKSCLEITPWLYRDEDTVQGWVHAFNRRGLQRGGA